ncbi:MAG: hypothetical protein ACE5FN_08425 [Leptospirillia bacterium]
MGILSRITGTEGRRAARQAQGASSQALKTASADAAGYLAPYGAIGQAGLEALGHAMGLPFEALYGPAPQTTEGKPADPQVVSDYNARSRAYRQRPGFGQLNRGYQSRFDPNSYAFRPNAFPLPGDPASAATTPLPEAFTHSADKHRRNPVQHQDVEERDGRPSNIDPSRDPGYRFRFDQGQQALERSAAARGKALSGQAARALARYGQQFASEEFDRAHRRATEADEQSYQRAQAADRTRFNRGLTLSNLSYGRSQDAYTRRLDRNRLGYDRAFQENERAYQRALTDDIRRDERYGQNNERHYGRLSALLGVGERTATNQANLRTGNAAQQSNAILRGASQAIAAGRAGAGNLTDLALIAARTASASG